MEAIASDYNQLFVALCKISEIVAGVASDEEVLKSYSALTTVGNQQFTSVKRVIDE